MVQLDRITQDPDVMGGKACIRDMRVTAGMIVGQIGAGRSVDEVLVDYPYLEREDIRHATLYMFNYGLPAVTPPPPVPAADPHHKLVSGLDVYFGMMRAEAMRSAQTDKSGAAKLTVPSGRGYYHLNISVEDNKTHAPVTDAQVTMQVSDGMRVETRTLERLAANNAVSYGNFFKFSSGTAYNITAEIKRPGTPGAVTAKFQFKAP